MKTFLVLPVFSFSKKYSITYTEEWPIFSSREPLSTSKKACPNAVALKNEAFFRSLRYKIQDTRIFINPTLGNSFPCSSRKH